MKKFILPVLGLAVIVLSSCAKDPRNILDMVDLATSHELTSFDIVGTDVDIDDQAPINPNVNNGEFHVTWSVREQYQNTVRLAISNDNSLSDNDVEIFFSICNLATLCGQAQVDMLCTFSTDNIVKCGLDSTSIADFLIGLPQDAFIIIESCFNAGPLLCDTQSHAVQFQ